MFKRVGCGAAIALLIGSASSAQAPDQTEPSSEPQLPFRELLKSPLVATGSATVAPAAAKKGDKIIVVPVRHRIGAVLKNDVRFVDLFATSRLEAGAKLYGVVLMSEYGGFPTIVWCAPSSPNGPSVANLGANGACLARARNPHTTGYAFIKTVRPPLLVRSLGIPPLPSAAPAPVIELTDESPLDGMQLEYRLHSWNKKEFSLTTWLRQGDREDHMGWLDVPREADGSARLKMLGGEIVFRQADSAAGPKASGTVVEVVGPLDDLDAVGSLGEP